MLPPKSWTRKGHAHGCSLPDPGPPAAAPAAWTHLCSRKATCATSAREPGARGEPGHQGMTRVDPRPPDPEGLLAAQSWGCLQRKLAGHHFSHTFYCTSFQTLRLK